jgi:hypothetical protein
MTSAELSLMRAAGCSSIPAESYTMLEAGYMIVQVAGCRTRGEAYTTELDLGSRKRANLLDSYQ